MIQHIGNVALLVKDYDEALAFYIDKLGFTLLEDIGLRDAPKADKRWVVISPPGSTETRLLLARADNDMQRSALGNQAGGRVFLFLFTDDFWRDYNAYKGRGVEFVRGGPRRESYGTVAVFKDLYGNLWDLIEPCVR